MNDMERIYKCPRCYRNISNREYYGSVCPHCHYEDRGEDKKVKLKYFSTQNIWRKEKTDYIRMNCGDARDNDNRVFSIMKMPEEDQDAGKFRFREECDQFFTAYLTKEETIGMLQEALDWIESK